MNTYFNEIKAKPVNTVDGKILYKIPSGAMCGNGDLGVVFDNDENGNGLVIHISKCDFWKFTAGAHKDGGIKTVGNLLIKNVDLDSYNIKQYFDKGLLECKFGDVEIEFFVAPENLIYFEIKAPVTAEFPCVDIDMPSTCGSVNSKTEDDGVKCCVRKFEGDKIDIETGVAVCCKETASHEADGYRLARYCVSVATNFDDDKYAEKAADMLAACDYDADKLNTENKWQKFFSVSKVTLEDKVIESYYNSSLYHLAGCMGNREFPPGLFGNFVTDDFFPWAGDYHMNYNYEAPYYCVFSANHPELFDGYMAPINDMAENAAKFAKLFDLIQPNLTLVTLRRKGQAGDIHFLHVTENIIALKHLDIVGNGARAVQKDQRGVGLALVKIGRASFQIPQAFVNFFFHKSTSSKQ